MEQNYQNPGKETWICEFCEYEAIFGTPPRALIRQYEIKDYKQQKALEERRRMLEKVKQKGRKGKKNSKATHKSIAAQAAEFQKREFLRNTGGLPPEGGDGPMGYDDAYDDRYAANDTEEDYIEDQEEYYDEDELDVPPPPPPQATAGAQAGPSGTRREAYKPPPAPQINAK